MTAYFSLSDIAFGVEEVESLSLGYQASLAEHKVLDEKPILQRTADSLRTLSVKVKLFNSFTDPRTKMEALEKALQDSRTLIPHWQSRGLGSFVLRSIKQDYVKTNRDGRPILIRASLELLEWADFRNAPPQGEGLNVFGERISNIPLPSDLSPPAAIRTTFG